MLTWALPLIRSPTRTSRTHVEVRHPIVAITPPNHPLANRGNVGLGDLRGYKVGMLHSSFGTRQVLDRALLEENARLDALLTINSIEMLKMFVSRGLGLAVLPHSPWHARNAVVNLLFCASTARR